MEPKQTTAIDRNERLDAVVTAYLKAVEAGQKPDRARWLAAHPDLAEDLASFFADEDRMAAMAAPLRPLPAPGDGTPKPEKTLRLASPVALGRFGDYELLEEIARGGMGVVYKAQQLSVHRTVALKMILSGKLASDSDVQRFHTEAEAAAQLDHPNIIPIYEVGEHEGQPFFTMKFIEGGSLAQRLPCDAADRPAVIALLARVARAVHYAHQRGILHRDLKPANILLQGGQAEGGRAKEDSRDGGSSSLRLAAGLLPLITDFGLAKVVQRGSDLTRSGAIVGTPSYMAPEQAKGQHRGMTTAADVYSLGAILFEVLTGRTPFRGETPMDTLLQVLEREAPSPRSINPRIDHDLETICLKCLEKDPRRRYESAEALAEDLENWLVGRTIRARPTTPWQRTLKWARREKAKAALVATVALAVFTATPVSLFGWNYTAGLAKAEAVARRDAEQARKAAEDQARREEDAKKQAEAARKEAEKARDDAVRARKDADLNAAKCKQQMYLGRIGLAASHWQTHNVPRVRELLEQCQQECPTHLGWEWHYLNRLCNLELLDWRGHGDNGIFRVAFSPDGKRLASLGNDHAIKVWDAVTGKVAWQHTAYANFGVCIPFSPDGTRLAFTQLDKDRRPVVYVWDLKNNREVAALRGHGPLSASPFNSVGAAFSPDGKQVATCTLDGTVRLWEADTGKELRVLRAAGDAPWCVAFSPDGERLAAGFGQGAVRVWEMSSGEEKLQLVGQDQLVQDVAFRPDGRMMATAGSDQTVRLWDAQTGKEIVKFDRHNSFVFSVAFSADGKRLASCSCDQTVKVWDTVNREELYTIGSHTSSVLCVAFSPTDDRLASAGNDGHVRIWQTRSSQDALTFEGHPGTVYSADFIGDGRRVVATSRETQKVGQAQVWDVTTGKVLFTFGPVGSRVAVSPDGKLLAASVAGNAVKLWDAETGKEVQTLSLAGPTTALAFSPDGKRLALAGFRMDPRGQQITTGEITIWDRAGGKAVRAFAAHKSMIRSLAFSPDGRRLVTTDNRVVQVWETETGQAVFTSKPSRDTVHAVAFHPGGSQVAWAAGHFFSRPEIFVHDLAANRDLPVMKGHSGEIYSLAFSPDGKRLASGSMDRTVKVWDLSQGEELLTLHGHTSWVQSVAYSPDGLRLVSGSTDRSVRIWDGTPLPAKKQ